MARRKNKSEMRKEVLGKIRTLFREAELRIRESRGGGEAKEKEALKIADRFVKVARKLAMKVNLKFPRELKRRFCKHCYCYLVPGKNCRVRIAKKMVIYSCFNCKKFIRFGILREKKSKRKEVKKYKKD